MRSIVVCLVFLSIALCDFPPNPAFQFSEWKLKYNKNYHSVEEEYYRYMTFKASFDFVDQHNQNPNKKWKAGLNEFSDQTFYEFQGQKLSNPQHCSATSSVDLGEMLTRPHRRSVDWREKHIVSPVKNQGQCGSCWTFSTTGCLEAHWALAHRLNYSESGTAPLLAEQQLVDCAGDFNNFGCNGGLPSQAFEYIHHAGGISTESQYPYHAKDGNCSAGAPYAAKIRGHSVNLTDEQSIFLSVAFIGPVSIAYDCMNDFMHYESGVYHNENCGEKPTEVNHAVLVVGYGTDEESGLDYWLVKNSWGTGWGLDGYFKIERGVNMCGLADCASFPDVTGRFLEKEEIKLELNPPERQHYL